MVCTALSCGIKGYMRRPLNAPSRAALLLITSGLWTDLIGIALILTVPLLSKIRFHK